MIMQLLTQRKLDRLWVLLCAFEQEGWDRCMAGEPRPEYKKTNPQVSRDGGKEAK